MRVNVDRRDGKAVTFGILDEQGWWWLFDEAEFLIPEQVDVSCFRWVEMDIKERTCSLEQVYVALRSSGGAGEHVGVVYVLSGELHPVDPEVVPEIVRVSFSVVFLQIREDDIFYGKVCFT